MKKFNSFFGKGFLLLFILFLTFKAPAQTSLAAGDIAFTGYQAATASTDSFSFVVLKTITANTTINFTDNAWLSTGVFRVGETHLTFTSSLPIQAGREITINASTARLAGNGSSAGTITYTAGPNPISFPTSGDQIIAYQGSVASPVLIAALHMNVYSVDVIDCGNTIDATWDPDCIDGAGGTVGNNFFSKIPTGLTNGVNALWIGTVGVSGSERDNGRFVACGAVLTTPAQVRAAVNNQANWSTNNTNPPGFPLPSFCNFLGISPLPVTLSSFTGKINADKTATLSWIMDAEDGVNHYILERSEDGMSFHSLGMVYPGTAVNRVYSRIDPTLASGVNYYRLNIDKATGGSVYSPVVALSLKSNLSITIFPNPVKDEVSIQQTGSFRNVSAQLLDIRGIPVQTVQINTPVYKLNMGKIPPGIYFLKTDDGSTFKLIKQ